MNKKQLINAEAKRLFGNYGYLGFTLKQLAQACAITSPALYYFYSSKADLFRDCLLAEMAARKVVLDRCVEQSNTLPEFAGALAHEAIEVCDVHAFRAGQAMREIIHLPEAMQIELRAAWDDNLITPVEVFLDRVLPAGHPLLPKRLLAYNFINMATFSSLHVDEFTRDELAALFVQVARGL